MNSASSKSKVNVAVVGLGFMGVTHIRAYQQTPAAHLAAVCDAVRLPVNGILPGVQGNITGSGDLDLGRDIKVFTRLDDVLADPSIDLVDLCTPTPLHPEQAIACLKAGKQVLCEKPLARTSASAREILKVAQAAPGFLMPAMCLRFWPGWSWLKEVVQNQTYGKVLVARFRRVSEMPGWSKQGTYKGGGTDLGGALFDLHIHDTDFAQFLFGKPEKVFATGVMDSHGAINHVVGQYLYSGGPTVHAEGSWLLTKGFNMAYTLHCERATLDYDLARGADAMMVTEEGKAPATVKYDLADGYLGEIRYAVECAQTGKAPQVVTCADGVGALEICEAEEQSIRTGTVVPVR